MSLFGQMKDLYKLQREAKKIQKELSGIEIEATAMGEDIKVVVSGDQKILELSLAESILEKGRKADIEKGLKEAINQAFKEAGKLAAQKSKGMMGDMGINLPGVK